MSSEVKRNNLQIYRLTHSKAITKKPTDPELYSPAEAIAPTHPKLTRVKKKMPPVNVFNAAVLPSSVGGGK